MCKHTVYIHMPVNIQYENIRKIGEYSLQKIYCT